jgi:radical SAM protein with 4Fe4S-binding SPASM domain
MKVKVRIIDIENFIFDIKAGQKRKSWIRVQARPERIEISTCRDCSYSNNCNLRCPICSQVKLVVIESGSLFTLTHFNFIKC